jgi:hypothetical protein
MCGMAKPNDSTRSKAANIYLASYQDPWDSKNTDSLKHILPKDENYFIIEGDLRLTEQELDAFVVDKKIREARAKVSPELILNRIHGNDDYYTSISDRTLTYMVDRASFGSTSNQAAIVEDNLRLAADNWEQSCPECKIKFVQRLEGQPVNFVVRFHDVHGAYIAASFFPHDDKTRRVFNIDPSYFSTTFDKVGVLRHELGHILGYRHEHIRGIAGCYSEAGQWRPLTPYDSKSVMHYFCGGAGSLSLQLTTSDIQGHRGLYMVKSN